MGIIEEIKRRQARRKRGGAKRAATGNGGAPSKKKAPARGGAQLSVSIPKGSARAVMRTMEQLGYQLVGEAALIESGATPGTAADAKKSRREAEQVEIVRRAIQEAL